MVFSILILPDAEGQSTPAPIQKKVNELTILCNNIQIENNRLKSQIRLRDSMTYTEIRNNVFEAFTIVSQLSSDYTVTSDKIAVTGLFTKLMQANNPTSDILGFRFSETIINASEKHLKNELTSEHEKTRFSQIIAKIVNNPVVSSLTSFNPITAVTSAIISSVAGFSSTTVEAVKEGNKVRDIQYSTIDAFSQQSIEAFREELKPYINFYDALNVASLRYISGIDNLNLRYTFLISQVGFYRDELYASIGCDDKSTFYQLSRMLPDPVVQEIEYHNFISDKSIHQCEEIAKKIPGLNQTVQDYKREYTLLLKSLLDEYIKALVSARNFTPESIDKKKIDSLVTDIEMFMKDEG
ncbi:MAG: hypothetical protein V1775_10410 [Bacteroidota bacterium]